MDDKLFRNKGADLERELLHFTTELKAVQNKKDFNELIDGAIGKLNGFKI